MAAAIRTSTTQQRTSHDVTAHWKKSSGIDIVLVRKITHSVFLEAFQEFDSVAKRVEVCERQRRVDMSGAQT